MVFVLFCFEKDVIPRPLLFPPLSRHHPLGQEGEVSVFQANDMVGPHILPSSEWFETDVSTQPFEDRIHFYTKKLTLTLLCIC